LRRTYVSVALLANNFDVMWVMSQVGHADSKMTTDVYAQLQQRVRREHGKAFDALVRRARERLYGPDADFDKAAEVPSIGPRIGPREQTKALEDIVDDWREEAETGFSSLWPRVAAGDRYEPWPLTRQIHRRTDSAVPSSRPPGGSLETPQ